MKRKPLILISNDDGIHAPGVHRLIDFIADLADIVCVCPDSPRSGGSMAITVSTPLRITDHEPYLGARMYTVNGSPVDCVKLAWHTVLRDRRPDLVLSGINHGTNAAINVVYSGTMGAAMEGCAFSIPSIGFSLTTHAMDADFEACRPFVRQLVIDCLEQGLPDGICLNVNIPYCQPAPTQMRLTRACRGNWSDEYREYLDPHGKPFYLLTGKFVNHEPDNPDTDQYCLDHGITSVVPVMLDRTAPFVDLPQYLKQLGVRS